MPAINNLPDGQSHALLAAYQAASALRRRRIWLGFIVAIACFALSLHIADVRPYVLWTHIGNFGGYVGRMLPVLRLDHLFPDIAAWFWGFKRWVALLGDTLLIAYFGTVAGAIGAFLLCFTASANLMPSWVLRETVRRLFEFCRSVPDLVFAMIFLVAFKSGPMAGGLALAVHTIGALGKLFAEVVENIDMKPVEGTTATGASWIETVRFAVLPQVLQSFASYTLLRFEINVRSATVMAFVGAGGISQELLTAIRTYRTGDPSAILLLMIGTVFLIDMISEQLRHRLAGMEKEP
ncbi:phosphonate ABC transporter, permease protein PhnE [Labrys miyagiensis]|uniref:phosphonate ABC transporter, permease protein PhnE n=1 Tax=Labrys miyagiensis TaxID=346912 RepID=UPI0024E04C4C|nr:phosphonate ABC transporter, permease protein PhnE [Labrys miyagiensis]